jgi:hypothetical protein
VLTIASFKYRTIHALRGGILSCHFLDQSLKRGRSQLLVTRADPMLVHAYCVRRIGEFGGRVKGDLRLRLATGVGFYQRFWIRLLSLVRCGLLFECGVNSDVPDGNGQTILSGESFDELNLLFTERCFWRPNVPEFVVVRHTISTHFDSLVNSVAEFLFEIGHGAILPEEPVLNNVT